MFKFLPRTILVIKPSVLQNCVRNVNDKKLSRSNQVIVDYFSPRNVKPPYHHVCQIGDPVLRLPCRPVDIEEIESKQFNKFVDHLISVMRTYDAFGISASQIGVPVQVCVAETTKKQYEDVMKAKNAGQQVEIVPLQIFINPKMKILDFNTTSYPECCSSVQGFLAHVPRVTRIKIDALDLAGKPFSWEAKNWPAKIAQHELDHLQGIVYTDKMDSKTFSCTAWEAVNQKRGEIALDFFPVKRSKWRNYFFR